MTETYEVTERVRVKFPIQGVKNRYGTVSEIRQGDHGPEYLVVLPITAVWCEAHHLGKLL
jgi:hypothetical protein